MAGVGIVAFVKPRSRSLVRTHINGTFYLFLDLLAPALLLGIWRAWTSMNAPRFGVYFTAEALLIAYAYFAVIRCTYVETHSRDQTGGYSRDLALAAGRNFTLGLQRYWTKIAIAVLSLLVIALALDLLTIRTGIQHRANVHLTILVLEIMVWARYGAAVVIASARWMPPRPAAFTSAREVADRGPVARSFALANIAFGAAALVAIAGYKWVDIALPSTRAELYGSAALFTALAFLALWIQCSWAATIARWFAQAQPEVAMPPLRQAA